MQGKVDLFDYLLVNHSGFFASSFAGKNIFYATDSKKEIEDAKSKKIESKGKSESERVSERAEGKKKKGEREREEEKEMKIECRYGNGCLFAKQ